MAAAAMAAVKGEPGSPVGSAETKASVPGDVQMPAIELYCICRRPYDAKRPLFMVECDACRQWLHGMCVGLSEADAARIERYVCPDCEPKHGPSQLKAHTRQSSRRRAVRNYAEVDNGVRVDEGRYTRELQARSFADADFERLPGALVSRAYLCERGFDTPFLVEDADGLGLTMPGANFSVDDVVRLVGGERPLNVIEVATQQELDYYNLYQFAYYFRHPSVRRRTLNVISLEVSDTELNRQLERPAVVRALDWVDRVWPPDDPAGRPRVQLYCLMGVAGCYTDFHIDFGGSSVFYHVVRGEKVFYFVAPTKANLQRYEQWTASPTQSDDFFSDLLAPGECKRFVIRTGQTLFIPSGWIHAVFTPVDTLVFGGNFLHDLGIDMQLTIAGIEHRTAVPYRFRYPLFRRIHWYAALDLDARLRDGHAHPHGPLTLRELERIPRLLQFLNHILDRRAERRAQAASAAAAAAAATAAEAAEPPTAVAEVATTAAEVAMTAVEGGPAAIHGEARSDEMPRQLWGRGAELIARLKVAYARAAQVPTDGILPDDGGPGTDETTAAPIVDERATPPARKRRRQQRQRGSSPAASAQHSDA